MKTNEDLREEGLTHEITIFAEPVFHWGNFTVNNSLLNTWLIVSVILVLSIVLRARLSRIPSGIQNFFELMIEYALNLFDTVTSDRKRSQQFFPFIFALFIFILFNNWSGLLPGIGSIGFLSEHEGGTAFIPYLRGGTADVNTTLALAILSIVLTHILGIISIGVWKHMNKFINLHAIIEIPKKIKKNPSIILVNPIKIFVGIIEIIGEIAKVFSLAFRLFGNIFAGEVLLTSIALMFAFLVPIPFMFLEIIVGLVQAMVFSMLVLVFLTLTTTEVHEH